MFWLCIKGCRICLARQREMVEVAPCSTPHPCDGTASGLKCPVSSRRCFYSPLPASGFHPSPCPIRLSCFDPTSRPFACLQYIGCQNALPYYMEFHITTVLAVKYGIRNYQFDKIIIFCNKPFQANPQITELHIIIVIKMKKFLMNLTVYNPSGTIAVVYKSIVQHIVHGCLAVQRMIYPDAWAC